MYTVNPRHAVLPREVEKLLNAWKNKPVEGGKF
jgi:hypothetical protein